MLYIINETETQKFPKNEWSGDIENTVLIKKAEFKFERLAQDIINNVSCGEIKGDIQAFLDSDIDYQATDEIPTNFNQICLPQEAGRYLAHEQIKAWRSLADLNIDTLRDNAELFYDNMLLQSEVAEIWYELMTGGN